MEEELEKLIEQMNNTAERLAKEDKVEFFDRISDAAYKRYSEELDEL